MTNEEIRNRFLFDFNLGVFMESEHPFLILSSKAIAFHPTEKLSKKFLKMLNDCGMEEYGINNDDLENLDFNTIILYKDGYNTIVIDDVIYKNTNNIPDYIREYELND